MLIIAIYRYYLELEQDKLISKLLSTPIKIAHESAIEYKRDNSFGCISNSLNNKSKKINKFKLCDFNSENSKSAVNFEHSNHRLKKNRANSLITYFVNHNKKLSVIPSNTSKQLKHSRHKSEENKLPSTCNTNYLKYIKNPK
jgi:hypothetical protein